MRRLNYISEVLLMTNSQAKQIKVEFDQHVGRDYATTQLPGVYLSAHRVENDVNGNPCYRVYVNGILGYDLPRLSTPVYTSRKMGYYKIQSYDGLHGMLDAFVTKHGEELSGKGWLNN